MKRVYILNTCDEWKSYNSFRLFGIWASSKAGTRRFVSALVKGIKDKCFFYEDEYIDVKEQIERLRMDAQNDCNTFYSLLQRKLIYGSIQLAEVR